MCRNPAGRSPPFSPLHPVCLVREPLPRPPTTSPLKRTHAHARTAARLGRCRGACGQAAPSRRATAPLVCLRFSATQRGRAAAALQRHRTITKPAVTRCKPHAAAAPIHACACPARQQPTPREAWTAGCSWDVACGYGAATQGLQGRAPQPTGAVGQTHRTLHGGGGGCDVGAAPRRFTRAGQPSSSWQDGCPNRTRMEGPNTSCSAALMWLSHTPFPWSS